MYRSNLVALLVADNPLIVEMTSLWGTLPAKVKQASPLPQISSFRTETQ